MSHSYYDYRIEQQERERILRQRRERRERIKKHIQEVRDYISEQEKAAAKNAIDFLLSRTT